MIQPVEPYSSSWWNNYEPVQSAQEQEDVSLLQPIWLYDEEPATDETEEVEQEETRASAAPMSAQAQSNPVNTSEISASMAVAGAAQATSMRSTSSLADMYRFKNEWLYGNYNSTWVRMDSDSDGFWSQDEIQAYADAYKNVTGVTLDVDDIMSTYGTAYIDGGGNTAYRINVAGQQQMYADDALGTRYFNDQVILAEYNQATTGSGSGGSRPVNQKAFDDFVSNYTYGSGNKLYAKIDKNESGNWTLDELSDYASAYYKATGVRLDVDALMAKYDKTGKGYLDYFDQNEMYRDDALGLSRIADMKAAQKESEKGINNDNSLANSIKDAGSVFSSAQKYKLATAFSQSIQKAAMLDAFMMTNSFINKRTFGFGFGSNNYGGMGMYSAWNYANLGMMQMFR